LRDQHGNQTQEHFKGFGHDHFMNEMGSKTLVSSLQETCICKGSQPYHELIHDEGTSQEVLFQYALLVGETAALGGGHSKKEATHSAAKCILRWLNELESLSVTELDPYKIRVLHLNIKTCYMHCKNCA
jgi:dsRNA-specific ribonuclease